MELLLNGALLDLRDDDAQARLKAARKQKQRPRCGCTDPMPEMYIAKVNDRFVVKRMPSTGPKHAPQCSAFLPPEELSGLSQIQGTAVDENPEDGKTLLRLDFPLSINGKGKAPPPPSDTPTTEAKSPARKLTLTSLLQYLWHEADLVKWFPAMEGKRSWGVVHRQLLHAAANKVTKRLDLETRLLVPEPFKMDNKQAIAARRQSFFRQLFQPKTKATPLAIVIAEYKTMAPTTLGARFTFKHMPDTLFFADHDLVKKFNAVFETKLMLANMIPGSHVMCIATFRMAPAGYPILVDIGMMLTTNQWIPFEHLRDQELIDALTAAKQPFIKSLRFNLAPDVPIATLLAIGSTTPTAMFVTPPDGDENTDALMERAAAEGEYPAWIWKLDQEMPGI